MSGTTCTIKMRPAFRFDYENAASVMRGVNVRRKYSNGTIRESASVATAGSFWRINLWLNDVTWTRYRGNAAGCRDKRNHREGKPETVFSRLGQRGDQRYYVEDLDHHTAAYKVWLRLSFSTSPARLKRSLPTKWRLLHVSDFPAQT